jgi:hypothetical protein
MTKDQVIEALIKQGVLEEKRGEYFFIDPTAEKKNRCQNLPDKYVGVSSKQCMILFIDDSEIPAFSTGTLRYSLHTTSKEAFRILTKILRDDSIDFTTLVSRTKSYYNHPKTAKPSVGKFFTEGLWETVYTSFEDKKSSENNNTFWL